MGAFLRRNLAEIHQPHALLRQLIHQMLIDLVLAAVQLPHPGQNRVQLFLRGHVRLVLPIVLVNGALVDQRTHPYHEKLVQIALENGNEAQAFAERHVLALRLLQHPFVEFQP